MLRRVQAGHYQYTIGDKTFVIVNVSMDLSAKSLWHCCEQIGDDPYCYETAFDAAETLRQAKAILDNLSN